MTERARIERVVEQAVCLPGCDVMTTTLCVKLLRRELAKRDARVRRIINAQSSFGAIKDGRGGQWILRDSLLAALRWRIQDLENEKLYSTNNRVG